MQINATQYKYFRIFFTNLINIFIFLLLKRFCNESRSSLPKDKFSNEDSDNKNKINQLKFNSELNINNLTTFHWFYSNTPRKLHKKNKTHHVKPYFNNNIKNNKATISSVSRHTAPPWEISTTRYNPLHNMNEITNIVSVNNFTIKSYHNRILGYHFNDISYSASNMLINRNSTPQRRTSSENQNNYHLSTSTRYRLHKPCDNEIIISVPQYKFTSSPKQLPKENATSNIPILKK